uniref:C2H2-type domain-containing protein n=1 Tax=Anopheles epiroticus TaxID=199890 RepID=A0A182PW64_9DIPT
KHQELQLQQQKQQELLIQQQKQQELQCQIQKQQELERQQQKQQELLIQQQKQQELQRQIQKQQELERQQQKQQELLIQQQKQQELQRQLQHQQELQRQQQQQQELQRQQQKQQELQRQKQQELQRQKQQQRELKQQQRELKRQKQQQQKEELKQQRHQHQMMLKKQALLQQMNLMSEYCQEQGLHSGLKTMHDIQQQLNAQRLQPPQPAAAPPPPPPPHQQPGYVSNQQFIQELHQQQMAMRLEKHYQMIQQCFYPSPLSETSTPPPSVHPSSLPTMQPAVVAPTAVRPKMCVKQAPMLNFVRRDSSTGSGSTSTKNNTLSVDKQSPEKVKPPREPLTAVPAPVEPKEQQEKKRPNVDSIKHPVPVRPMQVAETGPHADVAPATVLRSLPTPVQTAAIRVAVEAQSQPKQPTQQQQPAVQQQIQPVEPPPTTVLLTQLKQEPVSEELEEQERNSPMPGEALAPVVLPPPSVPTSPLPTTPIDVDTKPTIVAEVLTPIEAATPAATIDASIPVAVAEKSVPVVASTAETTSNRLDDNVTEGPRKQQNQEATTVQEERNDQTAVPSDESSTVVPADQLPTHEAEGSNTVDVAVENKTEQIVSPPPVRETIDEEQHTAEVNGRSNLREEINVQTALPAEETEQKSVAREGSVVSGDSGESSASSSSTEEATSSVVERVAKQSTELVAVVAGTEKESSPASDSGIESVNESGTINVPKRPRGRPKSSVSFTAALPKDDKIVPQVKEEKEQTCRLTRRRSVHISLHNEKVGEQVESDVTDNRAVGKRAVRTSRKPSVKAKEAAESAKVEHSADGAISNEPAIKCTKCEMCFKTELWYKKHVLNVHGLQESGSSTTNQALSPDVLEASEPPSTTETTTHTALTNGDACSSEKEPLSTIVSLEEADVSLQNGHVEEAVQHSAPVDDARPSKLDVTSPSTGRKRKLSAHSEQQQVPIAENSETACSSELAAEQEELALPPLAKVKVEHHPRVSGAHMRNTAAEEDETESEATSTPSPTLKKVGEDQSEKPLTSSAVTKEENPDPDDLDKLTPFEAAKISELRSEMTGETHYTCTICGGQFADKTVIREHLGTVHAAIKKRSCEYCGRTFVQTGDLTRHVRIHTGHRPFKCPFDDCGFAFISSGDLHKHVRRHTQHPTPKPHVCDQCGKDFERSYDLKRHKTMHEKSDPNFKGITCGVCGKVFARRDQFRAHTYRHIGYRPYQCEICGKAFADPSNFSKHARLHEMDGVEVVCHFCGRLFKSKGAISKHIFHCQQKTEPWKVGGGGSMKPEGDRKEKKVGKEEEKKSRRVGVAVGYGKDAGGTGVMLVKPKQENLADESMDENQLPSASVAAMNGSGRTKQQKQQQARKRKKRRERTPSSSEDDDDDDDSGDDFVGPSASELYGTSELGGGVVIKRERRSRASGIGVASEA